MTVPRPTPSILSLTEAAAERIRQIVADSDKTIVGLRVGVKNAGCAGMEYTMEYAESQDPRDDVIEDRGVKLLVDPKAILFLLGTVMDYKVDKLSAGFVFDNPNQTSACGCGVSVAITPVSQEQVAATGHTASG